MRRAMLAVACISALVSCKDSAAPDSVPGTYFLETVDSEVLPVVFDTDETRSVSVFGAYTILAGDKKFIQRSVLFYSYATGFQRQDTVTFTGTWDQSGNTIVLTSESDASEYIRTLSGRTLTEIVVGKAFLYRKP
jgi:hypothetical protein